MNVLLCWYPNCSCSINDLSWSGNSFIRASTLLILTIVKILSLKRKLRKKLLCYSFTKYTGHQDGFVSHSQLQWPSQEDQLTALHRQDTTVKIPEPGSEAEALPWTTEPEKNSPRRARWAVSLWLYHSSSRLTQCRTDRAPLGLQFF